MTYGVTTKGKDSGDIVGVQMYPYTYTCKTMLIEEVIEKSPADSCLRLEGITEAGLPGLG